MVSSVLRDPRAMWLSAVLVVATAALVGGCARVVTGMPVAGAIDSTGREAGPAKPVQVADLLIDPAQFPRQYPAAVLDAADVDRVLSEIDGVAEGSEVTPPECAPLPVLASQKAAAQGIDAESGARLIVTVIRPVPSLRARVSQLEACSSFTIAAMGQTEQKVTVALPPPPPVDADDTYAVDQVVTASADSGVRTLTLVALVGDVRVTASWQQDSSDAAPDTEALDSLFAKAVLKVRRLVPP